MGAWFAENMVWILPTVAGVAFFASRVHSRFDRGDSLPRALLHSWFPSLDPDNRHAHNLLLVDIFGKVFFAAIVIVILAAGYFYY
jgi:hypothetical protein